MNDFTGMNEFTKVDEFTGVCELKHEEKNTPLSGFLVWRKRLGRLQLTKQSLLSFVGKSRNLLGVLIFKLEYLLRLLPCPIKDFD